MSACVCLEVALGACVFLCVFGCDRVSTCGYCTLSVYVPVHVMCVMLMEVTHHRL